MLCSKVSGSAGTPAWLGRGEKHDFVAIICSKVDVHDQSVGNSLPKRVNVYVDVLCTGMALRILS